MIERLKKEEIDLKYNIEQYMSMKTKLILEFNKVMKQIESYD